MALKQDSLNGGRGTKVGEAISTAMVPIADVRECQPLRMKIGVCNPTAPQLGQAHVELGKISLHFHPMPS